MKETWLSGFWLLLSFPPPPPSGYMFLLLAHALRILTVTAMMSKLCQAMGYCVCESLHQRNAKRQPNSSTNCQAVPGTVGTQK